MSKDEMDPKINQALSDLQAVPPRDARAAQSGRAKLLKEAAVLRSGVSRQAEQRHNRWKHIFFPPVQRKERLPAMNAVIAVIVALVVLLGGGGATVYAAQDSLPDQALYQLKTLSEDAALAFSFSPETQLNYALDFSDRRVDEMAGLLLAGEPIPQSLELRFQNELELALQLVAGMDDAQAIQNLEQVRTRAETQLQNLTLLMAFAPESADPALLRTQTRLQEQIQLAQMGEGDPQELRLQMEQRAQDQTGTGEAPTEAGNGQGPANGPNDDPGQVDPGSGEGQPTGEPGQNGDGTGEGQPTDTPGQNGSGTGEGSSYGTPGQGGPGVQPTEPPQPSGNGSGNGSGNQP